MYDTDEIHIWGEIHGAWTSSCSCGHDKAKGAKERQTSISKIQAIDKEDYLLHRSCP